MKTTNVPFLGECPTWTEDISPLQQQRFKQAMAAVQQLTLRLAAQRLLETDDVLDWHRQLFCQFVPLECYAGHFRGDAHHCLRLNVAVAGLPGVTWQYAEKSVRTLFDRVRSDLQDLELHWGLMPARDRALRLAICTANLVCGFIQIHPFINGNGRTSRLVWRWMLYRFGVPAQVREHPRPLLPYSDIMAAAMRGDPRPCVRYVLAHLASHHPELN